MILWGLMLIVVLGGAIWAVSTAVGGETPKIGFLTSAACPAETSVPLCRRTEKASDESFRRLATELVRLNVGLDAKPLARVASGGELSRLMLALKVVLARHDAIATLVFDEVDQGIGGEVGAQVGSALAEVAERHQVLVITHLPQIAARADRHLVVSKEAKGGIATSDVQAIHGEDRVGEIARMLGDAEGDAARRHAQALLRRQQTARR